MRIIRDLRIWGLLSVSMGISILILARPILSWEPVVVESFGYELKAPNMWTIEHEQSSMPSPIVQNINEGSDVQIAGSDAISSTAQSVQSYSVNMFETIGQARIHVVAFRFPEGTLNADIIIDMEKAQRLDNDSFVILNYKKVEVDHRNAIRRMATYVVPGAKSGRHIEFITYVMDSDTLYVVVWIENNWLSLPRNLKIYNSIVNSFRIH